MCPVRVPGVPGTGEPDPALRPPSQDDPRLSPRRPGRPRLPRTALAIGGLALAAVAGLGVFSRLTSGSARPSTGPAAAGGAAAPSLPWPAQGQSSVLVEGLGERGELGAKGRQTPVPIASVAKVMTAYVVLGDHPLRAGEAGPTVLVDREAANEPLSGAESTVPVIEGQRLSERQALELLLIPSGNNIARMMARWDAGSEGAFVKKMNRAARALGMDHTTYTGASGFEATTTSTSTDQLVLARQAMRDEVFRSVVAERSVEKPDGSGALPNTNTLLGTDGVIGIKTGSSTPAGGALMWAATAPDASGHERLVLGVVLHQRAGAGAAQGLEAGLDNSRVLIEGVRRWLSTTEPGTH
ncbi:hypothetical protein GCM10018793_70570 [Streptomyces sulfonofaciens]|uniref:Peptidase S11 D-alanyl-D-alanine carboxypeptidase A N-terminal domain-containing protein n=1 Tax=Streptomyces sulfonofaciens TaxID=68272 RepID=A0A919GQL7_9ACTN|nr:D-alanyl-D-alanine carboxypeptidase [Streptomyces sulfonofaciens]GHH88972.1 hypothetical protein GCM10018793_70570 [Streptomyces sulfonofaciens]